MNRQFAVLFCHIPLLLILLISGDLSAAPKSPMIIKYVDRGVLDSRNAYKFELYKLLMESTRAEFGDYEFQAYASDPGAKRQSLLVTQGDQINLLWASPGTVIASAKVIPIPVDIVRGLLGYRICLINEDNQQQFYKIKDIDSLRSIHVGQVSLWVDGDIYNLNKIPLIQASSFEGLLGMLAANRVECLALGADEVSYVYRGEKAQAPKLAIEKSLLIYYDYPIYLYVSAKHPEIAKRIARGFQIIQSNGEFKRLFNKYFYEDLQTLDLKHRKIICLKSPFLLAKEQCQNINQLKALNSEEFFN